MTLITDLEGNMLIWHHYRKTQSERFETSQSNDDNDLAKWFWDFCQQCYESAQDQSDTITRLRQKESEIGIRIYKVRNVVVIHYRPSGYSEFLANSQLDI